MLIVLIVDDLYVFVKVFLSLFGGLLFFVVVRVAADYTLCPLRGKVLLVACRKFCVKRRLRIFFCRLSLVLA